MATDEQKFILNGVKVLDFTQYLAGPSCTRLMAEMGADIIKVERAPIGDPTRTLPYKKNGRSGYFIQQNRGKQSLCLDFSKPETDEILRELVKHVDIIVENFGPGVMEKRGLDYASASKINPRIIMASISAFGRKGPLSHRTGYDYIAQAFAGVVHMTGYPDRPPVPVGMGIGDVGSGLHAFAGIGYALFHRDRTGRGQHIDIAMADALFHIHETNIQSYTVSGGEFEPVRTGAHHALVTPCGIFKCTGGYIAMIVAGPQWPNLCAAMGRQDVRYDPRFATQDARAENQEALIPIIEDWLQSFPDSDAAMAVLEQHRVPAGPVQTIAQAVNCEHYKARDMIRNVPDPILGEVTMPGFPIKFSDTPGAPDILAPLLGEHGPAILAERLGWDQARIDKLKADGVLHMEAK